jgi:hypothetical protein
MLIRDPLSGSTLLALGLVAALCLFAQMRLASPWKALALSWLLSPLLYLGAEPLLYSPTSFLGLVLPRLPTFLANSLELYPVFFVKLAPIALLCVPVGLKRRASTELGLA